MVNFQDGAFRLAAENNLPVVPISLLDNYNILRDDEVFNMRRRICRVVYHEPIWAKDASEEEIKKLKTSVYRVIQDELTSRHKKTSPKKETLA